ncbi:hypothetical protein TIFTF001_029362 [Ficus carica]|uniref:Uncharacterized protein n=1 Tax=Ficus carica TaxID=3494 RepID=A0AA88DRF8_FICCA|nr:hypothetical protein TIFTF001_029362 [Ficus carica]
MTHKTSSANKKTRLPSQQTLTSSRLTSLLGQSEGMNQLEDNLDQLETKINLRARQIEPKPRDSRNRLESQPRHLPKVFARKYQETSQIHPWTRIAPRSVQFKSRINQEGYFPFPEKLSNKKSQPRSRRGNFLSPNAVSDYHRVRYFSSVLDQVHTFPPVLCAFIAELHS